MEDKKEGIERIQLGMKKRGIRVEIAFRREAENKEKILASKIACKMKNRNTTVFPVQKEVENGKIGYMGEFVKNWKREGVGGRFDLNVEE